MRRDISNGAGRLRPSQKTESPAFLPSPAHMLAPLAWYWWLGIIIVLLMLVVMVAVTRRLFTI